LTGGKTVNRDFFKLALKELNFPEDGEEELLSLFDTVKEKGFESRIDEIVSAFIENDYITKTVKPSVSSFSEESGINMYAVWLLVCLLAIESSLPIWKDKGYTEERFWYTFEDMTFKARKCKNIHGVWGLFVPYWYKIFYRAKILRFGCFEFEESHHKISEPYCCGSVAVKMGDSLKSLHIPASGMPFDRESRVAALKEAYEFFKSQLNGSPLVCRCHSWILYPDYKELYPVGSNLRDFFEDFDIVGVDHHESFGDIWRVFGKDKDKPYAELPENTTLQKAFKEYLLNGGKSGEGLGMFIFDGEKIITVK
jgi:hypothetical protein